MRCQDCAEEYLLAFSCKTRELCPSCAAKRAAATAALLREKVLEEVGHAQWVFVIPKLLRPYFLHHRDLFGGLARADWETVRELMVAATGEDGLLTEERTELLLPWRHTGFSVHNRVRIEPEDGHAVERLARYIMRPPISLERMCWDGGGEVFYRPKGGHDGRTRQLGDPAEAFDPAEFLARVIMHIPEPRRHLVRYYGTYSNVSRGKRKRQTEANIAAAPPDGRLGPSASADRDHSPDARALRRSWAQLIKHVYEVDPLVCPKCGGEMRIIAFIIDHEVVDAILRHLAKTEAWAFRGPSGAPALSAIS